MRKAGDRLDGDEGELGHERATQAEPMQAAAHDPGDVVQAWPRIGPQGGEDRLLLGRGRLAQVMTDMAAIRDRASTPA